ASLSLSTVPCMCPRAVTSPTFPRSLHDALPISFQWTHPGKQLLFMGAEFAQGTEWSEQSGLPWWLLEYPLHRGAQQLVTDLNAVQAEFAPLYQRDQDPGGFEWLIGDDAA